MSDLRAFPVNTPLMDGNEAAYLAECVDSGWISSEGPFVKRFEDEFAQSAGRKHGIAVNNGTAALQVAFEALDLPRGSEVILPSFTIISCASCLARLGLVPVPVDCDPHTFNSTVEHYEKAITPQTSAILIVHIYGLPVDVDPVLALAAKHGLKVVEDNAEMIGQMYKGRPCGSFGDLSTASFYPNKHITTGEGGMVMCDDDRYEERCRNQRNLCFDKDRRYIHEDLGWNYRMTNMQAALGVAQLEKLDRNVILKRKIGHAYDKELAGVGGLQLPVPKTGYADNIYWVYGVVLTGEADADVAIAALAKEKVGARHFFHPMHKQPVLQKMFPHLRDVSLPVSENLAQKGFYIPSGLGLNPDHIPEIAERVRRVIAAL